MMGRALIALLCIVVSSDSQAADARAASPWRSGWVHWKTPEDLAALIATAKAVEFQALIASGSPERMRLFSEALEKSGIESYLWLSPIRPPKANPKDVEQQLRPKEELEFVAQNKNIKAYESGFQGGGEPLSGRVDYNICPIACFHRADVKQATRDAIKAALEGAPKLTGIAFDMFGYVNFRDCVCAESERQLALWRSTHPEESEKEARAAFSFETLVNVQNDLADYARSLRPSIKTTVHVWPVYLDEPLYGNHLKVDYCCQTAAWFFKPYWSDAKITTYTKTIVDSASAHIPSQVGVPFIGLFVGKGAKGDKPVEEFARELDMVFASTSSRNLSIFDFGMLVTYPAYAEALKARLVQKPDASVPAIQRALPE